MKTAKPKLNADAAYENGHLIARDLLERIGEMLQDMPAPDNEHRPINWSNVGDISHVNHLLSQVVEFLGKQ